MGRVNGHFGETMHHTVEPFPGSSDTFKAGINQCESGEFCGVRDYLKNLEDPAHFSMNVVQVYTSSSDDDGVVDMLEDDGPPQRYADNVSLEEIIAMMDDPEPPSAFREGGNLADDGIASNPR